MRGVSRHSVRLVVVVVVVVVFKSSTSGDFSFSNAWNDSTKFFSSVQSVSPTERPAVSPVRAYAILIHMYPSRKAVFGVSKLKIVSENH